MHWWNCHVAYMGLRNRLETWKAKQSHHMRNTSLIWFNSENLTSNLSNMKSIVKHFRFDFVFLIFRGDCDSFQKRFSTHSNATSVLNGAYKWLFYRYRYFSLKKCIPLHLFRYAWNGLWTFFQRFSANYRRWKKNTRTERSTLKCIVVCLASVNV